MLIQLLNGVVYGGLLYLLAVGLVLIFGLREVVNFAHGALFMTGAYIGFSVAAAGYWWGGLLVSVVAMAIVGCALDATVFRALRKHDHMVTVLVTFGLLLILETVVTTIWGKAYLRCSRARSTSRDRRFRSIASSSLASASSSPCRSPRGCGLAASGSMSARRARMRASLRSRASTSID
jgi:branched-subunit amino acid ABC-type transport system permease component